MRGVPRGNGARPHGGGALDRAGRRGRRPRRVAAVRGRRGWRAGVWAWRSVDVPCRRSWRGGRRARLRAGAGTAAVRRGRTRAQVRWRVGPACSAVGWRVRTRGFYSALPRHRSGRGTAAPRSVPRQALPRQRSQPRVVATSALCRATMHDVAQIFDRARAIGVAKSVSLKKRPC